MLLTKSLKSRYLQESTGEPKETIITANADTVTADSVVVSPEFDAPQTHSHRE